MDIIKRRSSRHVRRGHSDILPPLSNTDPKILGAPLEPTPRKPRRKWKWVLAILTGLVLLGGLAALGGYFWVKLAPLEGERAGRVNIMVMGVDSAATLSDTLMIVSLDVSNPKQPRLAMISLPRDLYLNVPNFGSAKINTAYTLGQQNKYPGGGAALAEKTIEENFKQSIQYHAVIDFKGFKQLIDTVGGVDVDIKTDLYDPGYPNSDYSGTEPFRLKAGHHHLDGSTALKVSRCRKGTCGDDYGRAARQQQVLLALKTKIMDPATLANPFKLKQILKAVNDNLKTDLSARQLSKLYMLLRRVPENGVSRHVIDTSNFLTPAAFSGSDLTPRSGNFTEISDFIRNIFKETKNNLPEAQR